jgi:hypothetical protein
LHVVLDEYGADIKNKVKDELREHGISHVTVEVEAASERCEEINCDIKKEINHCHHHHAH